MKKFLKLTLLSVFLLQLFISANAAGCPSRAEFEVINNSYPQKMMELQAKGSTLEEVNKILDEQMAFYESLLPACVQYFKTTQNPDCTKLSMFSVSYMLMDANKRSSTKAQILNAVTPVIKKCPNEYQALMMFIK
ncbi:hypothetical protein HDR58_09345 [bacterium]|nr:hypothetical protein [bacterium]